MNEAEIRAALGNVPLSGLRFFEQIGSTNDEAAAWAAEGAGDFALVVADEQTAGRGRSGSRWFTPPGTALALSVVLRPPLAQPGLFGRLAGLGALAVADACEMQGLGPEIKWPNDVLLGGRKVAGVLVESIWSGESLEASILGIGFNVEAGAVPPDHLISYPATSFEQVLGHPADRVAILSQVLTSMYRWRNRLEGDEFIRAWERRLAFLGKPVVLRQADGALVNGILRGLAPDGAARLERNHRIVAILADEISPRPADDRMG